MVSIRSQVSHPELTRQTDKQGRPILICRDGLIKPKSMVRTSTRAECVLMHVHELELLTNT